MQHVPESVIQAPESPDAPEVRIFMKGDHSITSIEIG